jgi:hypothetical protein
MDNASGFVVPPEAGLASSGKKEARRNRCGRRSAATAAKETSKQAAEEIAKDAAATASLNAGERRAEGVEAISESAETLGRCAGGVGKSGHGRFGR